MTTYCTVPCGESMPQCGRMYGALVQPMTTMILLRVLVALFVKQQFALAVCPDSFTPGTRSGTCYHKSSRRDTFKRCEQDVCVPLHSTLPMIKNYDEVSDTAEFLGAEESAWVGFTDERQFLNWEWTRIGGNTSVIDGDRDVEHLGWCGYEFHCVEITGWDSGLATKFCNDESICICESGGSVRHDVTYMADGDDIGECAASIAWMVFIVFNIVIFLSSSLTLYAWRDLFFGRREMRDRATSDPTVFIENDGIQHDTSIAESNRDVSNRDVYRTSLEFEEGYTEDKKEQTILIVSNLVHNIGVCFKVMVPCMFLLQLFGLLEIEVAFSFLLALYWTLSMIILYSEYLIISQLSSDLRVNFGNLTSALLIFTFLQFFVVLFPSGVWLITDDEPYVSINIALQFQLFSLFWLISGYITFYLSISISKKYGDGVFDAFGSWWSRFMFSSHLEGIFINLSAMRMTSFMFLHLEAALALYWLFGLLFFASMYRKGLCIIEINKIAVVAKSEES